MKTHNNHPLDAAWSHVRSSERNQQPIELPAGLVAGHLAALLGDAMDIDPLACRWRVIENLACDVVDDRYPGADYFGRLGLAVQVATSLALQADSLYGEHLHAVPSLTGDMRDTLRARAGAILDQITN